MNETWKTIPMAPSYEASDTGLIRRIGSGRIKKQRFNHEGRPIVTVCCGKQSPDRSQM